MRDEDLATLDFHTALAARQGFWRGLWTGLFLAACAVEVGFLTGILAR